MADQDDFLARWSRRKADARTGLKKKPAGEADESAAPAPESADRAPDGPRLTSDGGQVARLETSDAPEADREMTAEEVEEAYKDFDFEKLDFKSDYTQFMKKGVPEAIRQRALRKLWTSDPILANVDGLVDYGEDFTDAALAVKELVTSWKPGQGYRTDEDLQREREEYGPEDQQIAARKERAEREAAAKAEQETAEAKDAEDGEVVKANNAPEAVDSETASKARSASRTPKAKSKAGKKAASKAAKNDTPSRA